MAPVDSVGVDGGAAGDTAQLISVLITSTVALAAVIAVCIYARRHRVYWPLVLLVTGGLTSFLEPLFDHLYGLWMFEENQWTAFETYGISIPVWLPIVYVAYYGAWPVWLIHRWRQGATMGNVFKLYLGSVALAALAEEFYINGVELYNYQDSQPFQVFDYPIFVAFVNGVPPFLASIVYVRLLPHIKGWDHIVLLGVVPMCFAADSFGSGWLYLAYRHSTEDPNMAIVYVLAVFTVLSCFAMMRIAAKMAGLEKPVPEHAPAQEKEALPA